MGGEEDAEVSDGNRTEAPAVRGQDVQRAEGLTERHGQNQERQGGRQAGSEKTSADDSVVSFVFSQRESEAAGVERKCQSRRIPI